MVKGRGSRTISDNERRIQEIEKFNNATIGIINSLGVYLKSSGEIESEYPDLFKKLLEPPKFQELIDKLPDEIKNEFLKLIFEAIELTFKSKNISLMSPKDKIDIGKRLIGISEKMKKITNKIELVKKNGK